MHRILRTALSEALTTLRRTGLVPLGWVAGLETRIRLFDRLGLACRLEYGHGDIVENVAKWKAGGFRTSVGAEVKL